MFINVPALFSLMCNFWPFFIFIKRIFGPHIHEWFAELWLKQRAALHWICCFFPFLILFQFDCVYFARIEAKMYFYEKCLHAPLILLLEWPDGRMNVVNGIQIVLCNASVFFLDRRGKCNEKKEEIHVIIDWSSNR